MANPSHLKAIFCGAGIQGFREASPKKNTQWLIVVETIGKP